MILIFLFSCDIQPMYKGKQNTNNSLFQRIESINKSHRSDDFELSSFSNRNSIFLDKNILGETPLLRLSSLITRAKDEDLREKYIEEFNSIMSVAPYHILLLNYALYWDGVEAHKKYLVKNIIEKAREKDYGLAIESFKGKRDLNGISQLKKAIDVILSIRNIEIEKDIKRQLEEMKIPKKLNKETLDEIENYLNSFDYSKMRFFHKQFKKKYELSQYGRILSYVVLSGISGNEDISNIISLMKNLYSYSKENISKIVVNENNLEILVRGLNNLLNLNNG